ncbi:hypothetical protein [Amycolatopsis sp. DG1A-15b]|uniref:RipA family octameric membrane protein n=1 Tax=Amycolatopsis sp. DG1A-15b TaxID=3052846 RepID=UPI00255B9E8A|nr:hypothetical protein [Amycolatopsis sp. DG1A-15b]WIX92470.1 hypothetical protein QRY02_19330 [Amycolatopsis sp. DG1A-15b]
MLEEQLPASPYWRAELQALGEGKDKVLYWPLTHLEQWLPVIFAVVYVIRLPRRGRPAALIRSAA